MKWLILLAVVYQAHSAVCETRNFEGTYGFQLSGETTISGTPKPAASLGRLVFDSEGKVSGYSSANFTGYLLGNPVNGTYEMKTDCSFTWQLQDDSGGYQHFSGSITPDFMRVQYRQTDPGGPSHGLMLRAPQQCGLEALQKHYTYSISGSIVAMLAGDTARAVSFSGDLAVAATGTIQITGGEGSVSVESDCIVQMRLSIPVANSRVSESMNFRGVLTNEGRDILAIQTDPGATVTGRFTAK